LGALRSDSWYLQRNQQTMTHFGSAGDYSGVI
jgi:hypothetical protein